MKASIARRLADLERRRENRSRQMHIIKAKDDADGLRQMSELLAAGGANDGDGFLCLTGVPALH
jgi:hypothetical protein